MQQLFRAHNTYKIIRTARSEHIRSPVYYIYNILMYLYIQNPQACKRSTPNEEKNKYVKIYGYVVFFFAGSVLHICMYVRV